ncbi:hypothetical protein HJB99_08285 [Rhizobium sp. NLR17b]|uniref:hypothetical protein n=1 Tax=Rhizobium sp. NLR17b TaxID=2731114 RepID=UPI001C83F606|nr:hypothetical protein [Rhizobium sp. NLR17b]MBX5268671.1 hypothetical protein [Rhizobium sp. NLR17b]
MTVEAVLESKRAQLNGSTISAAEANNVRRKLPLDIDAVFLFDLMQRFPLSGTTWELPEAADKSGQGVQLQWLTPEQIADESLNAYPGISVVHAGFIPIGSCMLGSGDPYFLKFKGAGIRNPPLVRVPHDYASEGKPYPEEQIEIVSATLEDFFLDATIDP